MPKQKVHKGLKKRVKVTAKGKIKRKRAFGGHLMSAKTAKRKRNIRSSAIITGKVARNLLSQLPK